ncbi:hypothetical protein CBR_g23085 [Chara braunii]|uniref:Glycosyltransferase 2-like domain-containing protein n=1 Tax=Chara braunii TaxID=69332 RepID=A0A388L3J4_CHABU|nr:hypothetical protein CBR_g23085 [Chara braunii]|eukprot:GBG76870.1 hypothetical protein CBR_g23085 [Chara braunii]
MDGSAPTSGRQPQERRQAQTAGGWQHDTVTEDTDLSYRAFVAGWRSVYVPNVVSPSELPVSMAAYKSQQQRWTKGMIQVGRKLIRVLLSWPIPIKCKVEAIFHLYSNLFYFFLLCLLIIFPFYVACQPVLRLMDLPMFEIDCTLLVIAAFPLLVFYSLSEAHASTGFTWPFRLWRLVPLLALMMGTTIAASKAIFQGMFGVSTTFVRTPKSGDVESKKRVLQGHHHHGVNSSRAVEVVYKAKHSWVPVCELVMSAFYLCSIILLLLTILLPSAVGRFAHKGYDVSVLPFMIVACFGFFWVGCTSFMLPQPNCSYCKVQSCRRVSKRFDPTVYLFDRPDEDLSPLQSPTTDKPDFGYHKLDVSSTSTATEKASRSLGGTKGRVIPTSEPLYNPRTVAGVHPYPARRSPLAPTTGDRGTSGTRTSHEQSRGEKFAELGLASRGGVTGNNDGTASVPSEACFTGPAEPRSKSANMVHGAPDRSLSLRRRALIGGATDVHDTRDNSFGFATNVAQERQGGVPPTGNDPSTTIPGWQSRQFAKSEIEPASDSDHSANHSQNTNAFRYPEGSTQGAIRKHQQGFNDLGREPRMPTVGSKRGLSALLPQRTEDIELRVDHMQSSSPPSEVIRDIHPGFDYSPSEDSFGYATKQIQQGRWKQQGGMGTAYARSSKPLEGVRDVDPGYIYSASEDSFGYATKQVQQERGKQLGRMEISFAQSPKPFEAVKDVHVHHPGYDYSVSEKSFGYATKQVQQQGGMGTAAYTHSSKPFEAVRDVHVHHPGYDYSANEESFGYATKQVQQQGGMGTAAYAHGSKPFDAVRDVNVHHPGYDYSANEESFGYATKQVQQERWKQQGGMERPQMTRSGEDERWQPGGPDSVMHADYTSYDASENSFGYAAKRVRAEPKMSRELLMPPSFSTDSMEAWQQMTGRGTTDSREVEAPDSMMRADYTSYDASENSFGFAAKRVRAERRLSRELLKTATFPTTGREDGQQHQMAGPGVDSPGNSTYSPLRTRTWRFQPSPETSGSYLEFGRSLSSDTTSTDEQGLSRRPSVNDYDASISSLESFEPSPPPFSSPRIGMWAFQRSKTVLRTASHSLSRMVSISEGVESGNEDDNHRKLIAKSDSHSKAWNSDLSLWGGGQGSSAGIELGRTTPHSADQITIGEEVPADEHARMV